MQIEIKITADEKALEFSRNLGGISEYFKEALMTNAMEEHGINAREICEPENLTVEVPVEVETPTIEPDHQAAFEQPAVTRVPDQELRAVIVELRRLEGAEFAKNLIIECGAKNLSGLSDQGTVDCLRKAKEALGNA